MKNIKHIIVGIFFSGILFILMSCEDRLDELPPNTLIVENAITNEATAETAVNGMYSYFGDYGELVAFSITNQSIRANLVEISTQRSNYELQLSALEIEEDWIYIKNLWVDTFNVINAANNVIYQLEKFEENSFGPNRRNELLGEAYFLRGYATLYQMKMFAHFWDIDSQYGPLLRIEPSGLNNNFKARSSVAQGYDQIIEDLSNASEFGPNFYSVYKSSKNLAKAYLIEALLMRGENSDLSRAISLADEIIGSGVFTLASDFSQVYSVGYNSSELMFSREIREINRNVTDFSSNVGSVYSLLGKSRNPPNDNYFTYLLPDDTRYPFIIGEATAADGVTYNPTWLKHFDISGDVPMRFMRLTQIYLYKAEALARSGASVAEVLPTINILRDRAGMPLFEEADFSASDLQQLIFNELLIEVGVENGSEYFAAIRLLNPNVERIIKILNPAVVSLNQLVLPIPSDELLFNPDMVQNPGY
jgi:hypothetical protein